MAISLVKGQKINLAKEDGTQLQIVQVGVNWGAIEKKSLFGKKSVAVDLDASVGLFSANGELKDVIYFGQLESRCASVRHSGDDRVGDVGGDDDQDNEVITIDLDAVPAEIHHVAVVLNSFKKQDFADIPHAGVRIFDGRAKTEFATFDVSNDSSFAGKVSMVLANVYRHNGAWKFRSIGEATSDQDLKSTLRTFAARYI